MGAGGAKADAKRYRDGYPGEVDVPGENDNLKFYTGQIKSVPSGDFIDMIHTEWLGRYGLLESHHGYIQWLFPIRENGMNSQSQKLQPHEIEALRADPAVRARLVKSYKLMLDFYGMRLKDEETGEVERNTANYKDRYENLNFSSHNYLRITRILKCLGELGLEHYKLPWCEFFVREVFENNQLANTRSSLVNYWIPVLRRKEDQVRIAKILARYGVADPFAEVDEVAASGGRGGGGARAANPPRAAAAAAAAARAAAREDTDDDEDEGDDEEDSSGHPPGLSREPWSNSSLVTPDNSTPDLLMTPATAAKEKKEAEEEGPSSPALALKKSTEKAGPDSPLKKSADKSGLTCSASNVSPSTAAVPASAPSDLPSGSAPGLQRDTSAAREDN